MRISIFGLGYVGCVTAACLARDGHDVVGVDVNPDKVAMINGGTSPIIEPGLSELVADVVRARRLYATASVDEAIDGSDVAMICVGTPSARNGQIDMTAVQSVARDIANALRHRTQPFTLVLRSTVLPGTTEQLLLPLLDGMTHVSVAMNPEFMREGTSLADFRRPPMTLVGSDDDAAITALRTLYDKVEAPFVQTSIKTAEMTKYVSNTFHALKICFANEIGDLCESLGVDGQEVMRTFAMDRKLNISDAYLKPGFAYGGSCLPKDLRAMMHVARRGDVAVPLLASIDPSNEQQIRRGIDAVLNSKKKRIAVVGLAFKQGTDDLRESPMVRLVEALIGKGCAVRVYDPNVNLAALVGANRSYIEKEIPHIASLMGDDLQMLVETAEVVVIGNGGQDGRRAAEYCRPDQVIVDLTRATANAGSNMVPAAEQLALELNA